MWGSRIVIMASPPQPRAPGVLYPQSTPPHVALSGCMSPFPGADCHDESTNRIGAKKLLP